MSGTMGSGGPMGYLARALMGPQIAQQAALANMNQPTTGPGGIPLGSMSGMMAPNAEKLQAQNGSLPWFAVPGIFQAPQQPTPAMAPSMMSPSAQAQYPGSSNPVGANMMSSPYFGMIPDYMQQQAQIGNVPQQQGYELLQQAMNMGGGGGAGSG